MVVIPLLFLRNTGGETEAPTFTVPSSITIHADANCVTIPQWLLQAMLPTNQTTAQQD